MTYKERVRNYIQPLLARGVPRARVAQGLEVSPTFLTMVLGPRYPDVLPLSHLRKLAAFCGLSATESLNLFLSLASTGAHKGVHLDRDTALWLITCTALALKENKVAS